MKPGISIDTKGLKNALKDVKLSANEFASVGMAGGYVLVNGMRMRVPVDTSATRNSIRPDVVKQDADKVVVEVGPRTEYAPHIEYGIPSRPSYPMQPFIRPTATQDREKVLRSVSAVFGSLVNSKWPR